MEAEHRAFLEAPREREWRDAEEEGRNELDLAEPPDDPPADSCYYD